VSVLTDNLGGVSLPDGDGLVELNEHEGYLGSDPHAAEEGDWQLIELDKI
jgi:hypothetical protein